MKNMPVLQNEFKTAIGAAALAHVPGSPKKRVLIFSSHGDIKTQNLENGSITTIGTGYNQISGINVTEDGKILFIADSDKAGKKTTVYSAKVSEANKTKALKLFSETGQVMQLAFQKKSLYYVNQKRNSLSVFDLTQNKSRDISKTLTDASGLLIDTKSKKGYVSQTKDGKIVEVDLNTGVSSILLKGLKKPAYLSWLDPSFNEFLFTEATNKDSIKSFNISDGTSSVVISDKVGNSLKSAFKNNDLLIVCALKRLFWYSLKPDFPIQIKINTQSPFIGTYERIVLNFGTTGLTIDDLDFRFSNGEGSGRISLSSDDESDRKSVV